MERKIYIEKNHSSDVRLKRYVNHDSKSRQFAFNTSNLKLKNTTHERYIPILNQGMIGSCTGNAGIGALASNPHYNKIKSQKVYSFDENGAIKLYSDAEKIDGHGGYPPNDYGSCGLSIAKSLLNNKLISSYQHTFSLNDALLALTQYPILIGVNWYDNMFNAESDGRIRPLGKIVGGHEIVARQIDVDNKVIWCDNSWGNDWGINGRFYFTWNDFEKLLNEKGDVIVLIPVNAPDVKPSASKDINDIELVNQFKKWMNAKGLN